MKIAVYHNLPSGGAKRALFEIVRRLTNEHVVDVFTLSTSDVHFCDLRPLVRCHKIFSYSPLRLLTSPFGRINQLQRWRDLHRLDQLSMYIAQEIDTKGYDIIFANPCIWTQAPLVLRHFRTPAVYYCQEPPRTIYESPGFSETKKRGWRKYLDRVDPLIRLYRRFVKELDLKATQSARVVLVNSRFMRSFVAKIYQITPEVMYLGVDTEMFRPIDDVKQKAYVLSVGAILPHKGFDFLIESIAQIEESRRPALRIVGNMETSQERARLEELAKKYGVNLSIELSVTLETLIRRYNEAFLMAYAPYNEPFGLAPLEAMACETPVIGVAEGGVRETVVDGVTGLIVRRDPQSFGASILSLMNNPNQRAVFCSQARAHVLAHWSWDKTAREVEVILGRVFSDDKSSTNRLNHQ